MQLIRIDFGPLNFTLILEINSNNAKNICFQMIKYTKTKQHYNYNAADE
uniref:Uncharacterized protein n=1 Tax=Strigamia maritima TaxID=126957 RepID=T1INW3_STRMM